MRGTEATMLRGHLLAAAAFAAAACTWGLAGAVLPGGRWLAIHLLTLGVLTNLLVGLMPHFARTLLRASFADDATAAVRLVLLNVGAIVLLVGLPTRLLVAVGAGATAVTLAVVLLWGELRRARRAALPSRFGFIGRTYERACGAFVLAAVLGAAMGLGLVPGQWYGGVRLAHLHVALLGWAGLPLLATLVTLGPTILRTRMAPAADVRAARTLPLAAVGLTVAAAGLGLSGAPAPSGRVLLLVGASGLAAYAAGVAVVCGSVLAVWRSRVPSLSATLLAAACAWFPASAVVASLLVAVGATALLEVLAPALLVGVLAQAVLAALLHLLPLAMRQDRADRTAVRERLARLPTGAAVTLNVGVGLLILLTAGARAWDGVPPGLVPAGWAAVTAGILLLGATMAWTCLTASGQVPQTPVRPGRR